MRLVAAMTAVVLLMAGCGGDDDPAAAPTTAPTTAPTSAPSAVAPTASGSPASTPSGVPTTTYRGTTPCDAITRPVPLMTPGAQCELATWRVELGVDGRYELAAAYGMTEPGTSGIRGGGTRVQLAGIYAAENGVIALSTDDPALTVRFLRVGVDVLYLLGPDDQLVVGNAAWSYTLNRAGKAGRRTAAVTPVYEEPGSPGGGVFEGRTPCTADVRPFTANLVPGCAKLKWRLTLRQNAAGQPAGYTSGVVGRDDSREGSWNILTGIREFPDAVVYELRAGAEGTKRLRLLLVGSRHLFMVDANDDLLVGDELWSYTLSRIE